ncbi:hypothetical protein [Frondihabitans australicus]|uniref:Glycosyl transferase family 2 n=1 Tax=Frondihabitans australicus TaxID=386892 RepID=A0A495IGD2_9MICO|nr:hypothetical protein [Frondihabitans australicus]RKR75067.1 hypothetical protein C8E83_2204 [Frondihabitans australicus]
MDTVDVDVIIPALATGADLARLMSRLPEGYRAIVAVHSPAAHLVDIVRAAGATLVVVPQHGFGAAASAGLAASTGSVVVMTGPESQPTVQEVETLVSAVVRGDADVAVAPKGEPTSGVGRLLTRLRDLGRAEIAGPARAPRPRAAIRNTTGTRAAWRSDLVALDLADRGRHYPAEMLARAAESGLRIAELDPASLRRPSHRAAPDSARATRGDASRRARPAH